MTRHLVFLTKGERNKLLQALTSEDVLTKKLKHKLEKAPEVSNKRMSSFNIVFGNTLDCEEDAVSLLGNWQTAQATRDTWEEIFEAFLFKRKQ